MTLHSRPGRLIAAEAAAPASARSKRTGRIAWYLQRLKGMSAAEIAHRLAEAAKREVAAKRNWSWANFDCGDGPVPSLPVANLVEDCPAQLLRQWEEVASLALTSRLPILGQTWPARRSPRDWHQDPVTRDHWPHDVHCFKVPFRHTRAFGDVKYMWERSRLQYLQPIAALARKTDDETLARFYLDEIADWMDGNTPFDGLSWATGVEVALRTVTLLVVAGFLCKTIPPGMRRRMRACLAAHGYWLARYPSRHSSANNHLIAEAAGLFLLGSVAKDMADSAEWAREGRLILCEEIGKQILADGVGAEQSPTYAAFTIEWYLLSSWLAREQGQPLPRSVRERQRAAAEHFHWMLDANGYVPSIGDDDEGRVLYSTVREDRYVASVAAAIAGQTGRPELSPAARDPHLRDLFFGSSGPASCPSGVRSFDQGGYSVIRKHFGGSDVAAVLDHGPLGYLSIAAHGHADALSLWLHVDGQPVLVDAGTYLYHSGKEWRDHFRGSSAHNTLTLNGADSSRMSGPFNWTQKARAWREAAHGGETIAAAHDGYSSSFGVTHRRSVTATEDGSLVVRDRLVGNNTDALDIRIGFLVHPSLDVSRTNEGIAISRGSQRLMTLTACAELDSTVEEAWYSPRFGEKVPTRRIVFSARRPAPCDFEIALRMRS
ncbi:MAG: alginate lyase family protein [Pseudomonadota bacterium]|nr:alginate lyase family protein [Pseudomonadota bacterium]